MEFQELSKFGNYISKSFAKDLLRLLHIYKSISASEAASRLGLHIQTIQEFLEVFTELGILKKTEVLEGKRPYYRYSVNQTKNTYILYFNELFSGTEKESELITKIREKANSGANFTTARNGLYFSAVSIWQGRGRIGKQKKINFTISQGQFMYNLPFPDAEVLSIDEIMLKAGISEDHKGEILDIVEELISLGIIERME